MTDSLLRLLLVLPVVVGVAVLAHTGMPDTELWLLAGGAAVAGSGYLILELALRPRRRLARRARQLAPGGACDGDEWAQIEAS